MKKNLAWIIVFLFICNCGFNTPKNYYYVNKRVGTDDIGKLLKKKEKIKKLWVSNYTSELFPNPIIENFINLEQLGIGSDSLMLDSNTDDKLVIDTKKLAKLKNLSELSIVGFSMYNFPQKISNSNLTKLVLYIDNLKRLELDLSELTKLEELHLGFEYLVKIDSQIIFPTSLKKLSLYSTQLDFIDLRQLHQTEIETIELSLEEIPDLVLIKLFNSLTSIATLQTIKMTVQSCERKEYLLKKINPSKKVKLKSKDKCKQDLIE